MTQKHHKERKKEKEKKESKRERGGSVLKIFYLY
jgi:hypothetical protein